MTLPERQLWAEVLAQEVLTAGNGDTFTHTGSIYESFKAQTQDSRNYVSKPNRDCYEVCYLAGIDPEAFQDRMRKHLADAPTIEELWERKRSRGKPKVYSYKGHNLLTSEWANLTGMNEQTIRKRLSRGWTIEATVTTPWKSRNKEYEPKPITPANADPDAAPLPGDQSCAA